MATTVLLTAKLFISHLIFINWICAVFVCFIMWRQMAVVWQLSLNHLSNVLECRISKWGASLSVVIFRPLEPWFPDKQPAVLAPAEANTSIRIQMSTSIQVPVFSHNIYKDPAASLCERCVYIETFDNRKLTMWFLFKTYFGKRTHITQSHTEPVWEHKEEESSHPGQKRNICYYPSPAQPAQPSPGSLETVQSHTKTRHKTADILQILPSCCWTRRCRAETCPESFFSRHLECQPSTPMSPSNGPHGTDVFTHKRQ